MSCSLSTYATHQRMLLCNSETTVEVIDRKGGNQITSDISLTDHKFDSKRGQNYRYSEGGNSAITFFCAVGHHQMPDLDNIFAAWEKRAIPPPSHSGTLFLESSFLPSPCLVPSLFPPLLHSAFHLTAIAPSLSIREGPVKNHYHYGLPAPSPSPVHTLLIFQ